MVRRAIIVAGLLAGLAAGLPAYHWQPVLQASLAGGWAQVDDQAGSGVVLGDLVASPTLVLDSGATLNPLIFINSGLQQRSLEEQRLFMQTWAFGARPTYLRAMGPDLKLGLRLLAQANKNWESVDELASHSGHYDSEEYGAGALLIRSQGSVTDQVALDLSHRGYPNIRDLDTGIPNEDAWWAKLSLKRRARLSDDKVLSVSGWAAWRQYTDEPVVQVATDGSTSPGSPAGRQFDIPGTVDLGLAWRLDPEWAVDLGVGADFTWSNQNQFVPPATSIPGVDDELAWRVDVGLLRQGQAWRSHVGYEFLQRLTGHPIQDPDTTYTQGLQADVEHGVSLNASYQLSPSLSLVLSAAVRWVLSNQEYSLQGPANYRYENVTVGLDWGYTARP